MKNREEPKWDNHAGVFFLQVEGPKQDLHSGVYGGAVIEPMTDLIGILGECFASVSSADNALMFL